MQHVLEVVVEVFLVGTGSFLRWVILKQKETFIVFFKAKSNYWNDLFIGAVVWIMLSLGGYYTYVFIRNY